MKPSDVLFLGTKHRVAAISRTDGRIIWSTDLPHGMGANFVSVAVDGARVFAYAAGHLHALDFATGTILWSNELPGFGFGIASLALPGNISDVSAAAAHIAAASAAAAGSAGASGAA
jgi:outer membrane protein assembly factor BamB